MTYDNTPLAIADVEASMSVAVGHRICDIGEDGDQLLILGHLDDELARTVVVAHAKAEWGYDGGDLPADLDVTRGWWTFAPHRDGCTDDVCDPCVEGRHDDCTVTDDTYCECADSGDGHGGRWCGCDEYGWFASPWPSSDDLPPGGHPDYHAVTWVRL